MRTKAAFAMFIAGLNLGLSCPGAMAQAPRGSGGPQPESFYLSAEDTMPVNGKGGSNIMGPYLRVKDWPQLPDGRMIDSAPALHVESPDRVFIGTRGTRAPWPSPVGWQRQTIAQWFRMDQNSLAKKQDYVLNVFDRNGKLLEHWGQYDSAPIASGIQRWHVNADDPERRNYLTGSGRLVVLSHDGSKVLAEVTTADIPTGPGQKPFSPEGIAFGPDGSFWVASHDRIIRFSPEARYVSQFGTTGTGPGKLSGAHDIIFDRAGHRFYVADQFNHQVLVYDEAGKVVDLWPNIVAPSAIRMTRDRKFVWVGDIYAPRFLKFDLEGHLLTSFGTWGIADGAISGIHDFEVDSEGSLYVANHDIQAAQKFRPVPGGNPDQVIGQLLPR